MTFSYCPYIYQNLPSLFNLWTDKTIQVNLGKILHNQSKKNNLYKIKSIKHNIFSFVVWQNFSFRLQCNSVGEYSWKFFPPPHATVPPPLVLFQNKIQCLPCLILAQAKSLLKMQQSFGSVACVVVEAVLQLQYQQDRNKSAFSKINLNSNGFLE